MSDQIPRILVDSIAKGIWKQVPPDVMRRCLGDDLPDLELFENLELMVQMSQRLDSAGYVDDPEFCMTREQIEGDDRRLEFQHALFVGGSTIPGDDVFVAVRKVDSEECDPAVLVLDWRKSVPCRWTERVKLSELINALCAE